MKLLAVDTATEACSAALYLDGEIQHRFQLAPKKHTQLILPMVDELMAEAGLSPQQLDGLAFGRGPGSFTGVRIATGIIQGIALGADLPVVPVSDMAAIAQAYFNRNQEDTAFVAMDARMSEIYWGVYQRDNEGFARLTGCESVIPATAVDFPDLQGVGLGTGWSTYHDQLSEILDRRVNHVEADSLPSAAEIVQLGADGFNKNLGVPVEQAMPVYLRDKVAKKESER